MASELYWTYAFNVIVNSALSFGTTVLLVEFFKVLFRIKQPRAIALFRCLPLYKICLDLFLYQMSNWALLQGINPLTAEKGTRVLTLMVNPWMGIQFRMQDGQSFSVADVIALSIDPLWIQAIVCIVSLGSVLSIFRCIIRLANARAHIRALLQTAIPIDHRHISSSLKDWLKQKRVKMVASSQIDAPCIAKGTLVFPSQLIAHLTQEEYEAVIVHEMAHLKWRDAHLRVLHRMISAIFWWVPTCWWHRRIEEMQEQACDAHIHRYGVSEIALASAILKTAQNAKTASLSLICSFVQRPCLLKNRMKVLLRKPPQAARWKMIQYGLLAICSLSILFGKLWIF